MSDWHSVHVDYIEVVDGPRPHLWIAHDPYDAPLSWRILDANHDDQLYSRAATLDHAIAFIRAAERNGHATVDETSVEFQRMWRLQFERLGREPEAARARTAPVSSAVLRDGHEPASRPSNVFPIRRLQEPTDCPPRTATPLAPPAGADSTPEGA